jgi:soluble lytic murein transglycosylase-like protein
MITLGPIQISRPNAILLGAALSGLILAWLLAVVALRLSPRQTPEEDAAWERRVWRHVERQAVAHGLDPDFVFAIVWAESSLRPNVTTSVARGMMQLTEGAWNQVSTDPYDLAFDWRKNIEVGVLYLAYNKRFLEQNNAFSYPMLAASYRYGRNAMRRLNFDESRIPPERNRIYQQIFAGNYRPVPRP